MRNLVPPWRPERRMKNLLLKLIQRYFLKVDSRFRVGDIVFNGDNNYEYVMIGIYYSYTLKPYCFMRDPADGKIYGIPLYLCRTPYSN